MVRFLGIKKKLFQVGFDDFYQAGSINKFRPMNIVAESRALNLQFWICADGGYGVSETYHISERPLDNCYGPAKRANFRTQADVVAGLEQIRLRIEEAKQLNTESANLNTDGDMERAMPVCDARRYVDAQGNLYFVRGGLGGVFKGFRRYAAPKPGQRRESGIRSLSYVTDFCRAQLDLDQLRQLESGADKSGGRQNG